MPINKKGQDNTEENGEENKEDSTKNAEDNQFKFCRDCGNKLPIESRFCDKCGVNVEYS